MKIKIISLALPLFLISFLLPLPVLASHAPTFTVSDTPTGGDCTLIGAWDAATKACTLTADVTGHIVMGADGIVLECAGHIITGSPFPGNGVAVVRRSGVTVKNCLVTGFPTGFAVAESSNNILTGNSASATSTGFFIVSSSDNILEGNTVIGGPVGGHGGFALLVAARNTLKNNMVTDTFHAFELQHSLDNTFVGNTASDNLVGFHVDSSNNNSISSNTVNGNSNGFEILSRSSSSSGNTFADNTVEGNNGSGFVLFPDSPQNSITQTMIIDNIIASNIRGISICHSLMPPENTIAPNIFQQNERAVFINLDC